MPFLSVKLQPKKWLFLEVDLLNLVFQVCYVLCITIWGLPLFRETPLELPHTFILFKWSVAVSCNNSHKMMMDTWYTFFLSILKTLVRINVKNKFIWFFTLNSVQSQICCNLKFFIIFILCWLSPCVPLVLYGRQFVVFYLVHSLRSFMANFDLIENSLLNLIFSQNVL